jgi:hypothetical protein
MKRLFSLVACACLALVAAGLTSGCQASGQPGSAKPIGLSCDQIRAAYVKADNAVTAATNAVVMQQAALDALPATDPARKALDKPLATAIAYAKEAQTWSALVKVAVASFCPELPQTFAPPAPATPVLIHAPPASQPSP